MEGWRQRWSHRPGNRVGKIGQGVLHFSLHLYAKPVPPELPFESSTRIDVVVVSGLDSGGSLAKTTFLAVAILNFCYLLQSLVEAPIPKLIFEGLKP
nr:hypothetical protein Iba_chr03cCG6510 [Ipomoea batatas]